MWHSRPRLSGRAKLEVLSLGRSSFRHKRLAMLGGTAEGGRPHIKHPLTAASPNHGTYNPCTSLPVRLLDITPRLICGTCIRIPRQHSLIFLHCQITLLQQIVHLSGRQVSLLQDIRIWVRNFVYEIIGGGCASKILLAPQQLSQPPRGQFVMQVAVLALATVLPHFAVGGLGVWQAGRRTLQVRYFGEKQVVPGIFLRSEEHTSELQS